MIERIYDVFQDLLQFGLRGGWLLNVALSLYLFLAYLQLCCLLENLVLDLLLLAFELLLLLKEYNELLLVECLTFLLEKVGHLLEIASDFLLLLQELSCLIKLWMILYLLL